VHENKDMNQAQEIASQLGLTYYVSNPYADSHIEAGQKLSQAIISRYPISKKNFALFFNP
jgi:N-acetyl-anhydromuramyl-L-alanine amidase AmpD